MQEALGRQSPTWLFLTRCLSPEPAQELFLALLPALWPPLLPTHTPSFSPSPRTVQAIAQCMRAPCIPVASGKLSTAERASKTLCRKLTPPT